MIGYCFRGKQAAIWGNLDLHWGMSRGYVRRLFHCQQSEFTNEMEQCSSGEMQVQTIVLRALKSFFFGLASSTSHVAFGGSHEDKGDQWACRLDSQIGLAVATRTPSPLPQIPPNADRPNRVTLTSLAAGHRQPVGGSRAFHRP